MEILAAVPILFVLLAVVYALSCYIVDRQIRVAAREIDRQAANDDPATCTTG
ncbi:hypothetical protein ACWDUD_17245 [Rhodococcus sp. NPDC003382]|uniref:hypothetical protein n=1 Tax=unclassified Rhodococcus (in: high G+C Gram-positive bacteria) TaxID=192944 RepID=UPI0018CFD079|nr:MULTISPECIES: hypothetical protein [unclassified Rhodococcus (in: high G+C Gram-positive bacteria)]MBH0123324.1 hypothetical protein [Rhodococcus sp. CX]MCK8672183.1 hypothetical protein [Rhodococcus sp. HM1]